ncbi:MAG: flagellar protein FlaG [Acidobacteriota bacterium]
MSETLLDVRAVPSEATSGTPVRSAEVQATAPSVIAPKEDKAKAASVRDPAALKAKVEQAAATANLTQVKFQYETTDDGNIIIKVKDAQTDKVIKQIPPEGQVEFARKLRDFLGILFDQQA